MAFANFPLLWLFGGRNNILIWATGWSFARLNVFHRHVARVATLQGIAHSLLYFVIIVRGTQLSNTGLVICSSNANETLLAANKLRKDLSKMYILWGILVSTRHCHTENPRTAI
jgi:ferric-chelate reductase